MPTATELMIDTSASAMDMAQTIFGSGVQVVSASYTGDPNAAGIYSDADQSIAGVTNSDSGVILSTGSVGIFTNPGPGTDTNTLAGAGTDNAGVDGDTDMGGVSGQTTFDGAILQASFIPDGDYLTMQFVFTSEEYPEYVALNVNDSFGVWVNGQFVEATITTSGNIAIDTVNQNQNQNLYRDNTGDQFNTEMDGLTYTLSFKAPVNPGQVNTIKIGIADGGDAVYDSNVLIAADSIQTVSLAFDDTVQVTANGTRTVDVLANDRDLLDTGLTITHVMGQPITVGQTVTIGTGEQVTLNADGTLTVTADGDVGSNVITYQIVDGTGNTDIGYLTITTVAAPAVDGVVQGTAAGDLIDNTYLGDPDGDRVDNADATGVYGTVGEDDYILAGAGNDTILAGAGNDSVFADDGNDSVEGGDGNDVLSAGAGDDTVYGGLGQDIAYLGAGNDTFGTYGADSGGNDSVYGGSGNDDIVTGAGDDRIEGGAGNDTLSGGIGSDTMLGGDGSDYFNITDDHEFDSITGGENGTTDFDALWFGNYLTPGGVNVTFTGDEAGTYSYFASTANGTFTEIEGVGLTVYNDSLDASVSNEGTVVYGHAGDDTVTGGTANDYVDGGEGNDLITGNGGSDSIVGGAGNDTINAGPESPVYAELSSVSGPSQTLTGTNGNTDFDHAATTTGPTLDSQTVVIDGGASLTGYHVGNGSDANETHTHSFTQEVAGAVLTLADIDPTETVVIWLDGVAIDLNAAIASGLVAFDPGTTGFVVDSNGALAATTSPVTEPVPATLTILQPFTTLQVQNVSATGFGNGTVYTLDVNTNLPSSTNPDNDSVEAGAGDDLVTTGAGDDQVDAGTGDDTVVAGLGNDAVTGGEGDDSLAGGEGQDTLQGALGNDTIDGGEDSDQLDGGAGNDSLLGGGADDTVTGGAGQDTLDGGDGNDLLTDLDGAGLVRGGEGDDTVTTGDQADTLAGDGGNDSLTAGAGNDSADGGLGDDTVLGGAGDDTILGGADQQVASTAPASYATLAGVSGTVTGTFGNADFTHAVTTDTGTVLESSTGILDGLGGPATLSGYQVGDGSPGDEGHTHSFGAEVASVQLRIVDLNVAETLLFIVDGQALDLNQAIGLGLVSFDTGSTSYYVDASGNLAAGSDAAGPFVPATLTINGPLTTLNVQHLSTDGTGNGTLYELSVDTNPAYETLVDGADNLSGDAGNDVIAGGSGNDTVSGGSNNDSLTGDAGDDALSGDAGNDTLSGGAGNDSLFGGDDRDSITGGSNDAVDGGEGGDDLDTLVVNDVASVAYGGGNDEAGTVFFNDGTSLTFQNIETIIADGVLMGPPDEIVHGTGGNDTMAPGYVDVQGDIIDGADGDNDTILAGDGDDVVTAGEGNDSVEAGAGNDSVDGGDENDTIQGGTGDDTLSGGLEQDQLYGEDGADSLFGGHEFDRIYGGADNDTIDGGENTDFLYGGAGDDSITDTGGSLSDDSIYGGDGNDTVYGGNREDLIQGDAGNDLLSGDDGDDSILGGTGADLAFGGLGKDSILGEAGSDGLWGETGNDTLDGGDNDDTLVGGTGADSLIGGAGRDTAYYHTSADGVTVNLATGTGTGGDAAGDVLTGVEDLVGSAAGDSLTGDTAANRIDGRNGNDTIDGGAGADELRGGVGNDLLTGGIDADTLFGEDDSDTIFGGTGDSVFGGEGGDDNDTLILNFADVQSITYGGGTDEAGTVTFIDGGTLTFAEIENINYAGPVDGTAGNDTMLAGYTDAQGDIVDGADGDNDTIFGHGGDDFIEGTAANDTVFGGTGNDAVFGGVGNNLLYGDEGDDFLWTDNSNDTLLGLNDTLYGGIGNDELWARYGNDQLFGGVGDDVIHGGPGNDTAYGEDGNDQLNGGSDNATDLFYGGIGNDVLRGDGGNDLLYGGADDDTVYGGNHNDLIEGSLGNDALYGDDGDDTLTGAEGIDLLSGGAGDDSLSGGDAADDVLGGAGNDTLYGDAGTDFVDGGDGNDTLYGGADSDVLFGSADADVFYGGSTDQVDGGEAVTTGTDNDTLYVVGVQSVAFDAGNPENGTVTFTDGTTLLFSNIENLYVDGVLTRPLDFIVEGSAAADEINATYLGDPEGDRVDASDNLAGTNADLIEAYGGNDAVSAGDGADTVYGGTGDDTIAAGAGNDQLFGEDGNDSLLGEAGNDTLGGAAGRDTILGGDGDDRIVMADGFANDVIEGGETGETSGDTLDASALTTDAVLDLSAGDPANGEDGTLQAGAGNDATFEEIENFLLGSGNDQVQGSSGADNVSTGAGADTVIGGAGNDVFDLGAADGAVDLAVLADGDGDDSISGFEAPTFAGGSYTGHDQLDVSGLLDAGGQRVDVADVVVTDSNGDGTGHAILTFPDGTALTLVGVVPPASMVAEWLQAMGVPAAVVDDIVEGTAGADVIDVTYLGDPEGERVDAGDSDAGTNDDLIEAYGGNDAVAAGQGDDTIYAGSGDDTVYGGLGDDLIELEDGNDRLFSAGSDTAGNDTVYGGAGDDYLVTGADNDQAFGGAGNDTLSGGVGSDTLDAGADNDWIFVNDDHGYDRIIGGETGSDNDGLEFGNFLTTEGVNVLMTGDEAGTYSFVATPPMLPQGTGDFVEVEALTGTAYADLFDLAADGSGMQVWVQAGNDTVIGGSGNDTVDAGTGDDELYGGDGNDSLDGGAGNDYVEAGAGDDSIQGGDGNDGINGGAGNDIVYGGDGTDAFDGGDGDDTLYGGAGSDDVRGAAGNDLLFGGDAGERLLGGTGEDILHGDAGNDLLEGQENNDLIYGGTGDDTLTGETGNDTLTGGDGNDALSGGDDRDTFFVGMGDTIDGGEGGDDFDTLDLRNFTSAEINVVYSGTNPEDGIVEFLDAGGGVIGTMTFSNIENVIVPCFTPGTLIATDRGERRVEDLVEGDRVLTRDKGYQAVRWIGQRTLSAAELAAQPQLRPVLIRQGALGPALPERDLLVSPQHRMLVAATEAELLFGEHEVLVPAIHLAGRPGIDQSEAPEGVTYIHLMLDSHEILRSDGAWSESYQPGEQTLAGMDDNAREEILTLFPELKLGYLFPAARITLKKHEAKLLFTR